MNLSSPIGDGVPQLDGQPKIEYAAQAVSPLFSGEVKLTISDIALTVAALFDTAEIPFSMITALIHKDYVITVNTYEGSYSFSQMGLWAKPFYDALYDAYNKAVLRSLFIKNSPFLTANGDFRYTEQGNSASGIAPIHIYENCITVLPPDLNARRVPLCFVNGLEKGDYSLNLRLDTGESYSFAKLGYDTAPFADAVEKHIRTLREKSLIAAKEIDPTLSVTQASQIARLMPEGSAASFGQLTGIAPSFVAALEEKLAATRAGEYYQIFKELCDPSKIYIGFKKNEVGADILARGSPEAISARCATDNPDLINTGQTEISRFLHDHKSQSGEETVIIKPDPYLLWLIAPSSDGMYAAVEFAEADTATFVYRTRGNFADFARRLNRALEAISFKREVIRLTDQELRKPENSDYFMAEKRTAALQFIRGNYVDRVIHSDMESWKRKLVKLWGNISSTSTADTTTNINDAKYCGRCGVVLISGAKFCGTCGAKHNIIKREGEYYNGISGQIG